jgi:hypothetical protein
MLLRFFALSILIFTIPSFSAEPEDESWSALQLDYKINEDWAILNEIIIRYSHELGDRQLKSNRIGLQYTTDSGFRIANIFENRTTSNQNNNEFRNIFQLSDKYSFESLQLTARLRWETRRFADSQEWMTRFRLLGRADFTGFKFYELTPFLSLEQFLISNRVGSRLAGSGESRSQIGVVSKFLWDGKLETSFMDRRTNTPSKDGNPSSEKRYHVLNFVIKYSFE